MRAQNLASVMDAPSCTLLPKKTHIICTLGPSSRTVGQLVELLGAGMSVARFNFSHGSHEYHGETLANLKRAAAHRWSPAGGGELCPGVEGCQPSLSIQSGWALFCLRQPLRGGREACSITSKMCAVLLDTKGASFPLRPIFG